MKAQFTFLSANLVSQLALGTDTITQENNREDIQITRLKNIYDMRYGFDVH